MAVPQRRQSPSRRDMRRSHDALAKPSVSTDSATGEIHRRHHIGPNGYYRGRQVIKPKDEEEA